MKTWLIKFVSRFNKQKWKLVKIHKTIAEVVTTRSDRVIKTENTTIYFYLYESSKGNRRYEAQCSVSISDNKKENPYAALEPFNEIIYPWCNGVYFPDIPSYADMDLLEVQSKLSL